MWECLNESVGYWPKFKHVTISMNGWLSLYHNYSCYKLHLLDIVLVEDAEDRVARDEWEGDAGIFMNKGEKITNSLYVSEILPPCQPWASRAAPYCIRNKSLLLILSSYKKSLDSIPTFVFLFLLTSTVVLFNVYFWDLCAFSIALVDLQDLITPLLCSKL